MSSAYIDLSTHDNFDPQPDNSGYQNKWAILILPYGKTQEKLWLLVEIAMVLAWTVCFGIFGYGIDKACQTHLKQEAISMFWWYIILDICLGIVYVFCQLYDGNKGSMTFLTLACIQWIIYAITLFSFFVDQLLITFGMNTQIDDIDECKSNYYLILISFIWTFIFILIRLIIPPLSVFWSWVSSKIAFQINLKKQNQFFMHLDL